MIRKFFLHNRDLTRGPILHKLLVLAVPLMIRGALQSAQSLIDMFWVGKLGPSSMAAVAMGGMIVLFLFTIISGISIGTLAMVTRCLGAGDKKMANTIATQSILLVSGMALMFVPVGLLFTEKILSLLGASADVLEAGTGYLKILLIGMITMFLFFLGSFIFQSAGDTITPMKLMVLANLINIVLDPVFIFGIGVPRMNTSGAAVATVISQGISVFIMLCMLSKGRYRIHIELNKWKIKMGFIREVFRIGFPNSLQLFFRSLMGIVLIRIVATFGTAALAAYGIGIRLQMVILMPAYALGDAVATMVGQNLGAVQPGRAKKSVWIATRVGMIIIALISIVLFLSAHNVLRLFNRNQGVITAGVQYLRITAPFYIFIVLGIILNRALAGAGDTTIPMIITLFSLWGFQIPLALFLSKATPIGVSGIWWATALATALNGILVLLWFIKKK